MRMSGKYVALQMYQKWLSIVTNFYSRMITNIFCTQFSAKTSAQTSHSHTHTAAL